MSTPEESIRLARRPETTTVLWDLDGTLVGFHRRTFGVLMPLVAAAAFTDLIPPWRFLAMLRDVLPQVRANTGQEPNHGLLVRLVAEQLGLGEVDTDARLRRLACFGLPVLQRCFFPLPGAPELVDQLAARGMRQVIATNPLWPLETALTRLTWGCVDATRFAFIASGESMCRSKPQVDYYRDLLGLLGARPKECVMIGNDARNDGAASALGIPVYLLNTTNRLDRGVVTDPTLVTAGDWRALKPWLGIEEDGCSSC